MKNKLFTLLLIFVAITLSITAPTSTCFANEIFGDYVADYTEGPGARYSNPSTADSLADGFVDFLINDENNDGYYSENDTTVFGNDSAWASDYSSDDDTYADNADIIFFTGHGFGGSFVFTAEEDEYVLGSSDMSLGDGDADWLFAFTCNFTNPVRAHSDLSLYPGSEPFDPDMMNGLHAVCGYKTDMTITADSGAYCADYLTGYGMVEPMTVIQAWRYYGLATQNGSFENTMRIWYADDCRDDYIWGYGDVGPDPEPYSDSPSDYSYVDYKLNWN